MNVDSYLLLTTSASPNAKPMTISNIKHSCSNLFPQPSVLASFHLAISRLGSNLHKFDGGCCQHLACYLILCLGLSVKTVNTYNSTAPQHLHNTTPSLQSTAIYLTKLNFCMKYLSCLWKIYKLWERKMIASFLSVTIRCFCNLKTISIYKV